jgi:hypothetical protein
MSSLLKIKSRIKGCSEYRKNIDAALYAALIGLPVETLKSKLAQLPAESELSDFTVGDYISQLKNSGSIRMSDDRSTVLICDEQLKDWVRARSQLGISRLNELGLSFGT